MDYGRVKIADDDDYMKLKQMVDNSDGWLLEFSKNTTKVWTKTVANSSFKMIKVTTIYDAVNSVDLYNVLHDPDYRKEWDHNMIESIDIGYFNPNNDISYYSVSAMPLKSRDFVLQRSWLDTGEEQYIINHSVFHKDYPPRKGFVRAVSFFTGYLIRKCKPPTDSSCQFGYISQSDPRGVLPSWLVNKATQIFAPKYIRLLGTAAQGYRKWKSSHNPNYSPWHYPEQLKTPKIDIVDCVPSAAETEAFPELSGFTPLDPNAPPLVVPKRKSSKKLKCKSERANSLPRSPTAGPQAERRRSISLHSSPENRPRRLTLMACLDFTMSCTRRQENT